MPAVKSTLNLLKEVIEDDLEHIQSMHDKDARVGHKTADSHYFGYKNTYCHDKGTNHGGGYCDNRGKT